MNPFDELMKRIDHFIRYSADSDRFLLEVYEQVTDHLWLIYDEYIQKNSKRYYRGYNFIVGIYPGDGFNRGVNVYIVKILVRCGQVTVIYEREIICKTPPSEKEIVRYLESNPDLHKKIRTNIFVDENGRICDIKSDDWRQR